MVSESARALYEALRALEHRAMTARRVDGQVYSRRETAHAAAREPYNVAVNSRRISDWVPRDFGKAEVPRATDIDKVWAIVQVWSAWAGAPAPTWQYWEDLIEAAQPQRLPHAGSSDHAAGRLLEQVTDPFAVEVHRVIDIRSEVTGLPVLPAYVRREHDVRLEEIVRAAADGRSGIAVLAGGSSTGKTRACWEALTMLRESGGWRLWHPADARAAIGQLQEIGSRTVIWLDETHNHYLHTPGSPDGESLASGLRDLLHDPASALVLVLATMWDSTWDALTITPSDSGKDEHPRARSLLTGHGIRIPSAFTSNDDLMALRSAAASDPRLAEAMAQAADGEIIQYLAGVPVLLERYHMAPDGARALILAALDARRLGYSRELPLPLLEASAHGYLSDAQWQRVACQPDWLTRALAYTEAESRGVRGPLTRIHSRPGMSPPNQTRCILADYLERHIGASRRVTAAPAILWEALLSHHASIVDLIALAHAAYRRGLLRLACRFYSVAARIGYVSAYRDVAAILEAAGRADEALEWWVRYAENSSTFMDGYTAERVAALLERAGRLEEALIWWQRASAAGNRYASDEVIRLMEKTGRFDETIEWLLQHKPSWSPALGPGAGTGDDEGETAFLSARVARMLLKAGRIHEGMTWWRRSLATGYWPAAAAWVEDAVIEAGRVEEATAWLQATAEAGVTADLTFMKRSLITASNQAKQAASMPKRAERPANGDKAGETGHQPEPSKAAYMAAARQAAQRLAGQGQLDEALRKLRSRIDIGDFTGIELDLAAAVLSVKGREEEAIDWCRRAARNPNAHYDSAAYATGKAAELLIEAGRTEEAITWLKATAENADLIRAMNSSGIRVMQEAATLEVKLLAEAGRAEEALTWLQVYANMGVFDALQTAAQLLWDLGREEEAQSLRRYGWEPDGTLASSWEAPLPSEPFAGNGSGQR